MFNTTFNGNGPAWSNACVGDNGLPGNREYAKGYSLAANILLDKVLEAGELTDLVDQLVYPICFNMRHSIELRLKETVRYLIKLSGYKVRIPSFDLESSHDIGLLWGYIKQYAVGLDGRYSDYLDQMDSKIVDISEIDPTGQTFRYPKSNESQKHLVDVALINLHVLKSSFAELEGQLDGLEKFNGLVLDEYAQETYTKDLSRARIFDLAKALPERDTWVEPSFKETRASLKKEYDVSSNQFSKAIYKIEAQPELSYYINKNHKLLGLSDDNLKLAMLFWDKLHDAKSLNRWVEEKSFSEITERPTYEDYVKDAEVRTGVHRECLSLLTVDQVAGLHALFYLARDCEYSEAYRRIFEVDKRCMNESQEELLKSLMHILDKTNGFQMIITSLFWIGKVTLAEELIETYSISGEHDWLIACRDRSRFSPHPLLKYSV